MRYGVSMPNFGTRLDARTVAELASAAESAGWDGFFLWDHVLAFFPGSVPVVDPWIALTVAATLTQRIGLGTFVTPLPRRRPTQLARETATLDQLSGGRLVLGVGIGGMPYEWDYLGEEPDLRARGKMLDEGLEVLTGLWSGRPFSHEGRYYRVAGQPPNEDWQAIFYPPPAQTPRIPIWVAGTWPNKAPFRRAARWDGVAPKRMDRALTPDDLRGVLEYIARYRVGNGPFDVVVTGATPGDDPAAAAAQVRDYEEAGATWWLEDINPWRFGLGRRPWPGEETFVRIRQGPPE